MELGRQPLVGLNDFPNAFVWPTELNDSRPLASASAERQATVLFRELKILALFHPYVLIEDPYVVNSLGLHLLLRENRASIWRAIEAGIVRFLLRSEFNSYSEANEVVKARRFKPERYMQARAPLAEIDRILVAKQIAVHIQPPVPGYAFGAVMERLTRSGPFDSTERQLLAESIEAARREAADGYVSSATVVGKLRAHPEALVGRLIQTCFAARVLVGPHSLGVSASVAESDVRRAYVLAAAGFSIALDLDQAESLTARYPQRILPASGFSRLSFGDICELHATTMFQRYERALIGFRRALVSTGDSDQLSEAKSALAAPWRETFIEYLENLQLYLEAIAARKKVRLLPWLSQEGQTVVAEAAERREQQVGRLIRLIPVVGEAWADVLIPIFGFQPLPGAIGGLLSMAAEVLHGAHRRRRPVTLRRLADGSTIAAREVRRSGADTGG